jgi:class 3 adenylate cyclase
MPDDGIERRLAAILVADVVGYSRLMGDNEVATLKALQEHRFAVIDPTIGQYQGRVIKRMGDGVLVEFHSAVNAVRCAVAIQRSMVSRNAKESEDRKVRLRIGVNLGDIIVQDGDIFGDGVNLAARLEAIAEPDGVCISSSVFSQIESVIDEQFTDGGAHRLKNIAKPVRVYHYAPHVSARPANTAFRPFVDMPVETGPLLSGGCLCGDVRYVATEKPLGSMLCHCRICQRFSGAPILGGTTFQASAVRFVKGAPKYFQSTKIAERGFCANCGAALTYRGLIGVWTKWIMLWTASLDEPEKFPPTYHLGIESTMPWLHIHDDLPRTACKDSPSLVDAYAQVGEEIP